MDLYQPLYVPRPTVEPELFASLRPQRYGQDMEGEEREFAAKSEAADESFPAEEQLAERKTRGMLRRNAAPGAPADRSDSSGDSDDVLLFSDGVSLQQGVQSVAQAADVGELFQYAIDSGVTLPRQQSAMLPIVNSEVKGEKLSIYNPSVQAKHPLNGLRLTNSTELHLMQGPITVFDDGAYAGDAQIEDLPPGSERLVSYALDLDTEVAPESKSHPQQLVTCKLAKGILHTVHKQKRTQDYTIKNSGKAAKQVLVEYIHDPNWTLLAPEKPAETTRDLYRFAVTAEPGEPAKLSVEEEMIQHQQFAISNLDDGTIQYYLNSPVVSEGIKTALAEVIKRKQELLQLVNQRQQFEQQIVAIGQEQERIRQNMAQLDRNTELYTRYVKKFGDQEDLVENLRGQIQQLMAQETAKRQELDAYILGLELE
jgi:hypothetical protein